MSDSNEWARPGATLTHDTAMKEYGVDLSFLREGARAGKLEWRETSMWGNPSIRLLRRQVEAYIGEVYGPDHLARRKKETRLKKLKTEINSLTRKLRAAETEKAALEQELAGKTAPQPGGKTASGKRGAPGGKKK